MSTTNDERCGSLFLAFYFLAYVAEVCLRVGYAASKGVYQVICENPLSVSLYAAVFG